MHKERSICGDYGCAEAFMPMYSTQRMKKRSEYWILQLVLVCVVLSFGHLAFAQIYLPKEPPDPSEYGRVILDSHSSSGPGAVVFDHWLHRSKFTCRLCHVDIGFAMQAKATGISASTNREGFHCGACHNGKRLFDGKPIFASCSDANNDPTRDRCHSAGKKGVRKYEYKAFTAKFPKDSLYGVNWEAAQEKGVIKPVDLVEGLSVRRPPLQSREDFRVKANYSWVKPIGFSHEKHAVWNGCEVCHPDIFPTTKKGTIHYSMFLNIEGRYCGACHRKVAFPLNDCQRCHPGGPLWAP
jgi:c(7)-type cytochrome triheme protein